MLLNTPVIMAMIPLAAIPNSPAIEDVQPVIMVQSVSMPQFVHDDAVYVLVKEARSTDLDDAVRTYHLLRSAFSVSHTEMAKWLGLKRRTLYNWLDSPERSTKCGLNVENRLSSLLALRKEMEPEHYQFLYKIAFSPIYGNPSFGKDILDGATGAELSEWYDKLFPQFESYRAISLGKKVMG